MKSNIFMFFPSTSFRAGCPNENFVAGASAALWRFRLHLLWQSQPFRCVASHGVWQLRCGAASAVTTPISRQRLSSWQAQCSIWGSSCAHGMSAFAANSMFGVRLCLQLTLWASARLREVRCCLHRRAAKRIAFQQHWPL